MAALLWHDLVFDLDSVRACRLQSTDGVMHVQRVAKTGVGIDNQRQRCRLPDGDCMLYHIGQADKAKVGQGQRGVRHAGAGDIDRFEPDILDNPGRKGVCGAGNNHCTRECFSPCFALASGPSKSMLRW